MKKSVSVAAAALASAAALTTPAALAAANSPAVTLRIEGANRTLLASRTVTIPSGTMQFVGHPYPADTVLGVLERATHGQVGGKYESFGAFVTEILGETHTGTQSYWETFIDGVAASQGDAAQVVKPGQSVLIAAVGVKESPSTPIVISGSSTARVGHRVTLHISTVTAKGRTVPLPSARVFVGGRRVAVSARGTVTVTPTHAGHARVSATESGYVRDETTLRVQRAG